MINAAQQTWAYLMIFPGPFLPTIAALVCFRATFPVSRRLFVAGALHLNAFLLCVAVPYYLQGYSQVEPFSGGRSAWGLLSIPPFAAFAYLFTLPELGFGWLAIGVLTTAIGDFSDHPLRNYLVKSAVLIMFAICLFEFHKYHATINSVLE